MIDISVTATRARGIRDNPGAPLDFPDPGPPRLAGTAMLSDRQNTILGEFTMKHFAADQRDPFRQSVLSRLSYGKPGDGAVQQAIALAAADFGFSHKQIENSGLFVRQSR
jgi:hypothetical protein